MAKGGVWCFYESLILNPNFVLLMKLSARKLALRQAPKRLKQQFKNFQRAIKRLQEVPGLELNTLSLLEKEGIIQRFEFTLELA